MEVHILPMIPDCIDDGYGSSAGQFIPSLGEAKLGLLVAGGEEQHSGLNNCDSHWSLRLGRPRSCVHVSLLVVDEVISFGKLVLVVLYLFDNGGDQTVTMITAAASSGGGEVTRWQT